MRLKTRTNFKISWTSNFGSKIWAKLQAKPNFSSQFLRVSGILKFALRYKFIKRETRGTWITVCLQLRACEAKPSPYLTLYPTIPSHVRGACDSASHCMRSILKSLPQILKFMSEHITLPNSVANNNETWI